MLPLTNLAVLILMGSEFLQQAYWILVCLYRFTFLVMVLRVCFLSIRAVHCNDRMTQELKVYPCALRESTVSMIW